MRIFIVIIILAAGVWAFNDKHYYAYSTEMSNGVKLYKIKDDKFFSGAAIYNEKDNKVNFYINNDSERFEDFEKAQYKMFLKSGRDYALNACDFETPVKQYSSKNYFLNPHMKTLISCESPAVSIKTQDNIKGFFIETQDGKKVRFGYQHYNIFGKIKIRLLRMFKQ